MTESSDQSSYEVGYGKPPKATQFQPGKSGNPRGRPKGRKSFSVKLAEALSSTVPLTINGRRQRVTIEDATIQRLMQGLLTAPFDKQVQILRFIRSALPTEPVPPDFDLSGLNDEELEQMELILEKLHREE